MRVTERFDLGQQCGVAGVGRRAGRRDPLRLQTCSGERPLWDFPDLVLGRHEVASYLISELPRLGLVPPTVWREDAPAGPGAVQMWVSAAVTEEIGIFPRGAVPEDFLPVLSGTDERGHEVIVGHRDEPGCGTWRCSMPSSTTPTARRVMSSATAQTWWASIAESLSTRRTSCARFCGVSRASRCPTPS